MCPMTITLTIADLKLKNKIDFFFKKKKKKKQTIYMHTFSHSITQMA